MCFLIPYMCKTTRQRYLRPAEGGGDREVAGSPLHVTAFVGDSKRRGEQIKRSEPPIGILSLTSELRSSTSLSISPLWDRLQDPQTPGRVKIYRGGGRRRIVPERSSACRHIGRGLEQAELLNAES